jgi:hypothetical protein
LLEYAEKPRFFLIIPLMKSYGKKIKIRLQTDDFKQPGATADSTSFGGKGKQPGRWFPLPGYWRAATGCAVE